MRAIILDRVTLSTTSVIEELSGGDWTVRRIDLSFLAIALGRLRDSDGCPQLLLDEARILGDRHFFRFKGQAAS
jgi:hypothetical protein